jgi:hypothetical protein
MVVVMIIAGARMMAMFPKDENIRLLSTTMIIGMSTHIGAGR